MQMKILSYLKKSALQMGKKKRDVALVVDSINQPVLPVDDQAISPVAVIGEPVHDEQLATNENQSQSTIALGRKLK